MDLGHAALGAAVTTALHPLTYARVLIQVGYEPVGPIRSTSLFGNTIYTYPNVFQYLGHIRRQDGFFGMYRGLSPRLCSGILSSVVTSSVQKHLKENFADNTSYDELDGDDLADLKKLCRDTTHETVARCIGLVVAQPFQVIMVRSMVQFVGRETEYEGIFSSIATIYKNEGILGFFSGLLPRLIGDVITIWLAAVLAHIADKYIIPKADGFKGASITFTSAALVRYSKGYTRLFSEALGVSQITYPFSLVSNVMAVQNSGLKAAQLNSLSGDCSWTKVWSHLYNQGQLKRGSSLFYRYAPVPRRF